jgi:hypothetical protein
VYVQLADDHDGGIYDNNITHMIIGVR